jgi:hypothetical protein
VTSALSLQGLFSSTWTGDSTNTSRGRATQLDLQAAYQIRLAPRDRQKPLARAFLKFSRLTGLTENQLFGLAVALREGWTVNSGVTVSLF